MKKVNIDDVKKLRSKTGASIMDCRKALVETNADQKTAEKIITSAKELLGQ